jgi:DNA-binding response OmpR family regulator
MRLLLVEDDIKIAQFVVNGLREAGFAVDHAPDGEDGLHLALTEPYDVAVVDLMLPKLDGLTLIEEVRSNNINMPVLILSAKRSVDWPGFRLSYDGQLESRPHPSSKLRI